MAVDVTQAIQDLIQRILNDRETAVQYSEDPEGTLAAQGITEGDASGLDMFQMVRDTCGGAVPGLRDYGPSSGPAGGSSGGPTPPPASSSGSSMDQVVQHMNYVTYETYKNDETIVQNIDNSTNIEDNSTNIDQSQNVDVDVDGNMYGGVDVDSHDTNVNATGDGSAASGDGPATAGDENLVNTGTNYGQQNTGDGAAQAIQLGGGRGEGGGIVQNTGDGGVAAGDDINAPVNTGAGDQQVAGGNIANADGGIAAAGSNVDIDDSALGFGEGDVSNVSDIDADEGSAVAVGGGNASGYKSDDDVTETTQVQAQNSIVQTEQGEGDASQEDLVDVVATPRAPVELLEESGGGEEPEETFEG